jgi:hypothetical protein
LEAEGVGVEVIVVVMVFAGVCVDVADVVDVVDVVDGRGGWREVDCGGLEWREVDCGGLVGWVCVCCVEGVCGFCCWGGSVDCVGGTLVAGPILLVWPGIALASPEEVVGARVG